MPKISELDIVTNLTQASYVPITVGNTTYRYNLRPAVTPLSDLNRVFHLTGDGIPIFPDNVAGTNEKYSYFTSRPASWLPNNTPTETFINGVWHIVANNAYGGVFRNSTTGLVLVRLRVISGAAIINFADGSGGDKYVYPGEGWKYVSICTGGSSAIRIIATSDASTVFEISDIYIGSGLFDTPVYGLDGQSVWTNHGVVPVNGPRGKGMLFQGGQKLVSKNPTQIKKVIAFKIFIDNNPNGFNIVDNLSGGQSGIIITRESSSGIFKLIVGDGSQWNYYDLVPITIGSWSDYVIVFSDTSVTVYKDGIFYKTMTIVKIGITSQLLTVGDSFNGIIADIRGDAGSFTSDDAMRYHNGDDPVDCQQKAITNVPNAIKVCDSKGNIRQPGLPVYADNTVALAGGLVAGEPYRTSTGVLMVVY